MIGFIPFSGEHQQVIYHQTGIDFACNMFL